MKRLLLFIIVPFLFVSCGGFSKEGIDLDMIPVKLGDKWGYVNNNGEYLINPQFAEVGNFSEGLAMVKTFENKWGYVDKNGKYIITPQYKTVTRFSEGLAFVVSEGDYPTCIDKSGEVKFKFTQEDLVLVESFSEGLALFRIKDKENNWKVGFVDKLGNVVINAQFEDARCFKEGLAAICQNNLWGFINKKGEWIINPQFDDVANFHNGLAQFMINNQVGFIDTKGKYVINPQFDNASFFSEELAWVELDDMYGYISKNGKIVINPQFDEAYDFCNGLAIVKQNGKYGYINKKGKFEINPQFEEVSHFYCDNAFVQCGQKWGIIDKKGKYVANPQFDDIMMYSELEVSCVVSDFYDAYEFVNNFMEKTGKKTFDGFAGVSTLRDIKNRYSENIHTIDRNTICIYRNEMLTDEISVSAILFHFENPIWEYKDFISRYVVDPNNSNKRFSYEEKIGVIEYVFNMSEKAAWRGCAIGSALKREIERKYNVKLEKYGDSYASYNNNDLSFGIKYSDFTLQFFVGFDSNTLIHLFDESIETEALIEAPIEETIVEE